MTCSPTLRLVVPGARPRVPGPVTAATCGMGGFVTKMRAGLAVSRREHSFADTK